MNPIIEPVDRKLLKAELKEDIFLRSTNNGNNELYSFTAQHCPNLMNELGRVRELTFRAAGGGTGKEADIDEYDTSDSPYHQLIVWDPVENEILGGYRYIKCNNTKKDENGAFELATAHLFNFSDKFTKDYLPKTIELGRSFVQPKYQATKELRAGLYALDNLWDGLGALIVINPDIKYFFGKVTMYNHFNREARNLILFFMNKYFPDKEMLVKPHNSCFDYSEFPQYNDLFVNENYTDDYKILFQEVKKLGEMIPPLFSAYMKLTDTMVTFGTSANDTFGEVEETGILVTVDDINPARKERHFEF